MHLSQIDYQLPSELIAQQPAEPRDSARLLVFDRATETITHDVVRNLGLYLPQSSQLVVNNSRVRRARLFCTSSTGKPFEVLVLEPASELGVFRCIIGGRKPKPGLELTVLATAGPSNLTASVLSAEDTPGLTTFFVRFASASGELGDVATLIEELGQLPLPPYITSSTASEERYQTVFAKQLGSAAAPTAGLHLTHELLTNLEKSGVTLAEVTLHVGIGTFLPLRSEQLESNRLHAEQTEVSEPVANQLSNALAHRQIITAVGTTSFRTLESHTSGGQVVSGSTATDLFAYPGYRCSSVGMLFTNFHLPKSSLLALVAAVLANPPGCPSDPEVQAKALLSQEQALAWLHHIYSVAIAEKYRFYSFGDAMLIR
jgi:S-adenosylmethionine:tRNA ribosyltransferase-isomerase